MKNTLVLDGNNLMFRAAFVPQPPVDYNGVNVAPARQFLRMVRGLVREHQAEAVYAVWDKKIGEGTVNFRKQFALDSGVGYKDNRVASEAVEHVWHCCDVASQLVGYLGVRNMYPYSLEGDDVIAWIVRNVPGDHTIVSADGDLWQLIGDNVSVYDPNKKVKITPANWGKYSTVQHEDYVLYKAIIGDNSDNIPGVPRVGPKRAVKLVHEINKHGIDLVAATHKPVIERNVKLMDLSVGLQLSPQDVDSLLEQDLQHEMYTKVDLQMFKAACATVGLSEMAIGREAQYFRETFAKQQQNQALFDMFS